MNPAYLPLHTAQYEWSKDAPIDVKRELSVYFASDGFLNRVNTFFKAIDPSSGRWTLLISAPGLYETRRDICAKLGYTFPELRPSPMQFQNISEAPKFGSVGAFQSFGKQLVKLNKAFKMAGKLEGWKRTLQEAANMVHPSENANGSWFISVDIESYEVDHSKILEIGWSIWDSGRLQFMDKHYAVQEFRHFHNGRYVADRRDRFNFGTTQWRPLNECIDAFQKELDTATDMMRQENRGGKVVLIAHDMSSDEGYLTSMGVKFPRDMVKFDTVLLNAASTNDVNNKMGLGKVLDELEIENYCLHNAGNDAHYTLELFLRLTRDAAQNIPRKYEPRPEKRNNINRRP